jgi:hypothetical protein
MARKTIDLQAVRRADAELKRIARETPEAFDRLDASIEGTAAMLENPVNPKPPAGRKAGTVVAVRLEQPVLDRIDAVVGRIQAGQPFLHVKRSDALRLVILEGLKHMDEQDQGPAK